VATGDIGAEGNVLAVAAGDEGQAHGQPVGCELMPAALRLCVK
jgi:hypothetical protein